MKSGRFFRRLARADVRLARRIVKHQSPTASKVLPRLSNAANHSKLWFVVAGLSAWLGGRQGRRAAPRGLLSVGIASAVANGVLKPLLPRPRPPLDPGALISIVRRPSSSAFPSGHAASAAAYATATALEAPAIAAPVAALAAGVAYSRISTGVHYPGDVIVGGAVGITVAVATTKIWPLTDPAPARARTAPQRSVTEPSPTGQGITLVVNAASGPSAHDRDLETINESLPDITVVHVEDPASLSSEFAKAAKNAVALGVLGGDGTISAAAAAALDSGVPLVVFPGGTFNHFARDLGVDTIGDAVSAVQEGKLVEVDAATIDGRVFLNTASFGNYSKFVEAREKHEEKLGKWLAVAIALSDLLVKGKPFEADLNGSTRKIWMIFIGNCAYDPPGFAPASRDRLDDGKLDVRIIDGTDPHARLRLAAGVLTGRLGRSKVYTRQLVDQIQISTSSDNSVLAADGETFEGNKTFMVAKAKTRLRTYAPHQ